MKHPPYTGRYTNPALALTVTETLPAWLSPNSAQLPLSGNPLSELEKGKQTTPPSKKHTYEPLNLKPSQPLNL